MSKWIAIVTALVCAGCFRDFDKFQGESQSNVNGVHGSDAGLDAGHNGHAGRSGSGGDGGGGGGGSGGTTGSGAITGSGGAGRHAPGDGGTQAPGDGGATVHACDTAHCDTLASCDDATGDAVCTCPVGYVDTNMNGTDCTDKNECASDNGGCHEFAQCKNTPGGFTCTCNPGYNGDGIKACEMNKACDANGGSNCSALAHCQAIKGVDYCVCNSGYSGNGETCSDIDECATSNGGCGDSKYYTCQNDATPGVAPVCDDVHECATSNGGCGDAAHWDCIENVGADPTCRDKDECAKNHGGCDALTTCNDMVGSRTCGACPSGYMGTGETGCNDYDQCAQNNGGCDALTGCHDYVGYRTCDPCPAGYTGTGETGCVDFDECSQSNGGCGATTCIDRTAQTPLCGSTHFTWVSGDPNLVTDTNNGLVWQRQIPSAIAECGNDPYCTQAEGQLYCVNLNLGGISDWRLPAQAELEGLLNGMVDPNGNIPSIDLTAFPNTPIDYYWSIGVVDTDPTYGWVVNFAQSNSTAKANVRTYHVRCVH